jgi:pantoate--beta-alanine ligase
MIIFQTAAEFRDFRSRPDFNRPLGFVPTMGALHEGHIALLEKAKNENAATVVSIFVNPLQFNNPADYANYPVDTENDIRRLREAGADFLFLPEKQELLRNHKTRVFDLGFLDTLMEGACRPGHFQGVANIVSLLFDVVQPDKAYFGEKDFQQLAVIRRMVNADQIPVEIIGCPTVREKSGLALSSRNRRLSAEEKDKAAQVSRFILALGEHYPGNTPVGLIRKDFETLMQELDFLPDYFEVCRTDTLESLAAFSPEHKATVCVAYHAGAVRLIDNCSYPVLS